VGGAKREALVVKTQLFYRAACVLCGWHVFVGIAPLLVGLIER
jgi:hypothetical protein